MREKPQFPEHKCVWCGHVVDPNKWDMSTGLLLVERTACFTCNFWLDHVERKDEDVVVRIDGTHYRINTKERGFQGFGGSTFYIRFHDGRRVETSNLWCQGDIPKLWQHELPDNAVWDTVKDLAKVEI